MEKDYSGEIHGIPMPLGLNFEAELRYFDGVVDWIPSYHQIREDILSIDDPVWGREVIGKQEGDDVLVEMASHDAFRRLQAVEQLTLPRNYSTIPNTSLFSRWEHVWGSVVLVRRLARQHGISDKDSLDLQLRTLLSDVGHTTGSHLGDWLFQGMGSIENQHDTELKAYLETTGVNNILEKHDISPGGVIFPETEDWIECPSPDMCVDRVDYGLREIRRWVPGNLVEREIYREGNALPDIVIEDEKMVMTDLSKAKAFGESYLELSREHWSDPVHRLQLVLYMERAKRILTNNHGYSENWMNFHPRDVLYCSDPEYLLAMQEHDSCGYTLDTIMADIAKYERRTGWNMRHYRVQHRLNTEDYESNKKGVFGGYPEHHPMLEIEELHDDTPTNKPGKLSFVLPALKVRQIDPAVLSGSKIQTLSSIDQQYAARLAHHEAYVSKAYVARIAIGNPSLLNSLRDEIDETNAIWQELVKRPRMSKEDLVQHIGQAARSAAPFGFVNYRVS